MIVDTKTQHESQLFEKGSVTGAIAYVLMRLLEAPDHYFKIDEIFDKYGNSVPESTFIATFYRVKEALGFHNLSLKKRGNNIYIFKKNKYVKFVPDGFEIVIEKKIKEAGRIGITMRDLGLKTRNVPKGVRENILCDLLDKKIIYMEVIPTVTKPIRRFFYKIEDNL